MYAQELSKGIEERLMFENLVWQKDRMLIGDLVFRLQHEVNDDWELGNDCFLFFKTQSLVNQYQAFFASRQDFQPQNVFELGLWDGGSLAFWFDILQPDKQIGIDIQRKKDSDYFRSYIQNRGLGERLKTYWGVDQSDASTIRGIVEREFDNRLDLVIDDASHMYTQTKKSFECLFPLLRPGGIYVIEDWAWEHWAVYNTPGNRLANKENGLTRLISEFVVATGNYEVLIKSLTVYQGFVAIERGDAGLSPHFELDAFTRPRFSSQTGFKKILNRLRGKSKVSLRHP